MPRLPRAVYDAPFAVPTGWSDRPCGYLKLSDAYEAEYEAATARGWPTVSLDSTHLGTFTDPSRVLDAILQLLDQLA